MIRLERDQRRLRRDWVEFSSSEVNNPCCLRHLDAAKQLDSLKHSDKFCNIIIATGMFRLLDSLHTSG